MSVVQFFLRRSGTSVTINILNREERTIKIFRSKSPNKAFSLLGVVEVDEHIDTVSATLDYRYILSALDFAASMRITNDHSTETPPYYVVQSIPPATFSTAVINYSVSWGSDIPVEIITVVGALTTKKSPFKSTRVLQ